MSKRSDLAGIARLWREAHEDERRYSKALRDAAECMYYEFACVALEHLGAKDSQIADVVEDLVGSFSMECVAELCKNGVEAYMMKVVAARVKELMERERFPPIEPEEVPDTQPPPGAKIVRESPGLNDREPKRQRFTPRSPPTETSEEEEEEDVDYEEDEISDTEISDE